MGKQLSKVARLSLVILFYSSFVSSFQIPRLRSNVSNISSLPIQGRNGQNFTRSCQISGQFVSTFDSETIKFRPSCKPGGCYDRLTASCNDANVISVSGQNLGAYNVKLRIKLLGGKAVITASEFGMSQTIIKVEVDSQSVLLPKTVYVNGQDVGTIRQGGLKGGIIFEFPGQSVQFNGMSILIQGDGGLNPGCGLCWKAVDLLDD